MGNKGQQPAPEVVSVGKIVRHKGMCEASGAIAIPGGSFGERFLVVDNETNFVRVYDAAAPGSPLHEFDVSSAASVRSGKKGAIDLEAVTWLNGRAMLMGSLGRTKKGKLKPARHKFLSLDLDVTATDVRIASATVAAESLLPALQKLSVDLSVAIGDLDDKKRKSLAPKRKGINLEGLSAAADGKSLMLGFRNPLRAGKALLVRLRNPIAVLAGAAPKLLGPYEIFLGGLGIRSIEYCAGAGVYFIVAGPVDDGCAFDLFQWRERQKPIRIEGAGEALAALEGFTPEGLIVDKAGKRLLLFGDNGGCPKSNRSFPSVELRIA